MNPKKELEEFLYIVSHDFNAPIRHVREFTNLLLEKLDDGRLKEKEKLYANYVRESVKELEDMLSGLLRCSRLQTISAEVEKFSLKELINEAINNHATDIKATNAYVKVACDKNIIITADRNHIKILIGELIENALKFRSKDKNPEINIIVSKQGNQIIFSIKDNGIGGISGKLKEEVFNYFKKLNPREEYKGAGIGLTLCKKITELYDGNIWVESSDSSGSQISFSVLIQN